MLFYFYPAVTVVHACVISALALYSAFVLGPWPFTDAGGPNDEFQVRTMALCLGYFLFDVAWSLYFHTEGESWWFLVAVLIYFLFDVACILYFYIEGTIMMVSTQGYILFDVAWSLYFHTEGQPWWCLVVYFIYFLFDVAWSLYFHIGKPVV